MNTISPELRNLLQTERDYVAWRQQGHMNIDEISAWEDRVIEASSRLSADDRMWMRTEHIPENQTAWINWVDGVLTN